MKKIQILFFLLIGLTGGAFAQTKQQLTAVIKTPTVQCEGCKGRIEKYMSHEEGILKINVDYKKKTTTVTYLTDLTNIDNIKALVAIVGYVAYDVPADSHAYKRFPTY